MNKRGILMEEVIFFLLNAVFFVILLIFISGNTNGRAVYEQAYAKQIAFMIDEAKPDMSIYISMDDALKIAEKSKIDTSKEEQLKKLVIIEEVNKKVVVDLGSGGGYSFDYFTDAKVSGKFQGIYFVIEVTK